MKATITINEFGIHISQAGKAGLMIDTGHNEENLKEALHDLAAELLQRYIVENANPNK